MAHNPEHISPVTVAQETASAKREPSAYSKAKAARASRVDFISNIKSGLLVVAGIFSAAFGLESFLLPNNFIDGGATGISLLIAEITHLPVAIFIVMVNIPFVFIGAKTIGRPFAIKTALAIGGLATVVATIHFPQITHDKLLVSVFGGFFLGGGIGLAVRGGAVIDGTEVLAIYLSRKIGISIGDVILLFNILIFSVAAYLLSIEVALYSILTYLAASRTVDFIIEGIEEYTGVTIISHKHHEIQTMIIEEIGRGVTIYKGQRGFGKRGIVNTEIDIIYTVLTRLEISKLQAEIEKIDDTAFVVMSSVKDTSGGMIKKRPLKH